MPADQAPATPFAPDVRVGEWLVQPSLDRVSRNGTTTHLRPQLTNLLVLLARRAGRTVSKGEILACVWEGQFVAESGLSRCIAELRRVLEDDAREPRIIETIPKRGYRLVAPVTFLDATPARSAPPGRPVIRQGARGLVTRTRRWVTRSLLARPAAWRTQAVEVLAALFSASRLRG